MGKTSNNTRRDFIKKVSIGTAALSFGGMLPGFSAKSYANILGANERIQVAMMGVNARGLALASNFSVQKNCVVTAVCDVDARAMAKCVARVAEIQQATPKSVPDFRNALEDKNVDALVVATPDHWHAPAAIMASQAGKHVYLEKPGSHNPREGELLVAAQKKYGNVIQMGNQRRSWPAVAQAIRQIHEGVIGNVHFAKTWYANNRASIGTGQQVAVPDWLDFDLWQGPAPRKAFQDNLIHYNWHWFWNWGTGEALNNGTHMVDIARWGMQVDYPVQVSSTGGRYRYQDDWETPDTQIINLDFADKGMITWEGRSCNGRTIDGAAVGVIFYGENGSLQIGGGNTYQVYSLKNELLQDVKNEVGANAAAQTSSSQELDAIHIQNFFSGIKDGTALHSAISDGQISTLLVQLGNIAQRTGETLQIDPANGRILKNKQAMRYWGRDYERGWEPKV